MALSLILDGATAQVVPDRDEMRIEATTPNGQLVLTCPQRVADELAAAIVLARHTDSGRA